jgi:hypothetical protein
MHASAQRAFRDATESSVSLVDRTSFAFMRPTGFGRAIALDVDFRTAGFETSPERTTASSGCGNSGSSRSRPDRRAGPAMGKGDERGYAVA